jgi:predicted phosphodiesterase
MLMKVAALYDIHGNLPALEAVLADVRRAGVDRIVVGGDVVPGPMPKESLALLRSLDVPAEFIRGNGERVVLAARAGHEISEVPEAFRDGIRWNAAQLDDEQAEWLARWPLTTRQTVRALGDVVFCHATPRNDTDVFTRDTANDRLVKVFDAVNAAVVVCGHTHMQFDRRIGATRVVNAGSVGMPFGEPGAYWLLMADTVELRCARYDFVEAAARIGATRYPQAAQFAATNVLHPPSEATMIAAFASSAMK